MKKVLFLLLMLTMAFGVSAQDKKVAFYKATVSNNQYQNGEGPERAIDGDYSTLWHSPYSGTSFPIVLTATFRTKTHVDYVRYVPRQNGENGNWSKVKVEYSTSVSGGTFVTVGTFNPNGSSSSLDIVLAEGGVECGQVRFTIESGLYGWASAAEIEAYQVDNTKYDAFAQYFTDNLFTELKPEVTSAEGIEDADVKALVGNLLSNAANYKKFRVGEYEAYMPTSTLRNMLKVSSQYNNYENPTGVYLKTGESCIVMASGIGSDAVGLRIKNWYTNEHSSEYSLKNGINYISATSEGNVFVNYYTNNYETAPNVKLHFINAPVQGYWDQETMTNADWKKLLSGRSVDDNTILVVRSKYAQTAYPVSAWLQHCPTNVDSTMTLYEKVQWAERDILGLERYGKQVKNRQLFYATDYGFMAAGGEGSYCHYNSLGGIMYPDAKRFDFWGVGHEWGHNNQVTPGFKWSGCGETTNNIYAAWAQLHGTGNRHSLRLEDEMSGIDEYSNMRGGRFQTYFEEGLRKGIAWQLQDGPDYHGTTPNTITVPGQDANGNGIGNVTTTSRNYDHFVKLAPFWQLTLWGTLAGKCPDIVPMVIESIRTTANYGSTYNTNGKQQVNWMKLACDSTKLNLLPFFEKAGMLRPINAYIEDYGAGWNIITEQMIKKLKSHVANQGYAEVTEELNYITAHNFHIYRDCLKLEIPSTLGAGCTYANGKVRVEHSQVKNAVAFETYNTAGELIRITMYGLGSNDSHSFTQVLYPGSDNEANAAAYIMAVGYDGTRTKVYENINIQKSLSANHFYNIVSSAKGGALTCGASTTVGTDGNITWSMNRVKADISEVDQIWQWQKKGDKYYLYNPQSGHYFSGQSNAAVSSLTPEADAKAWDAVCVDEEKQVYTFNLNGTGDYLNAYSTTETGFYGGGAGDDNNLWVVEEVKTVRIAVGSSGFYTSCMPFAVELPEGLSAYVVSDKLTETFEGETFDYAELTAIEGNVVPANTPVIYNGAKGTYVLTLVPEDDTVVTTPNLLKGATLKQKVVKGTVISVVSAASTGGAVGLIKSSTTLTSIAANKSYILKSDVDGVSQLLFKFADEEGTTAIEGVEAQFEGQTIYDIYGRPSNAKQHGIYIINGKKVIK